jgi:Protein of unknown function (DUF1573)
MLKNLVYCLWLLAMTPTFAQLKWDNRQVSLYPDYRDAEVNAKFAFVNGGKYPITIEDVKTSCGCTTATCDRKVYSPGETGFVNAVFHVGSNAGLQQKIITVQSDDPANPMVQLVLSAHLPELVKMEPTNVFWNVGDANTEKTIDLKVACQDKINILNASSTDPSIAIYLRTITRGAEYQVVLKPTNTSSPVMAVIQMNSDFPRNGPKAFYAFADIKQAR